MVELVVGHDLASRKEPVDVAAGFNTGLTGSVSYTNAFPIPSGKTGVIWYADYYRVKKMNIHTETCTRDGRVHLQVRNRLPPRSGSGGSTTPPLS